MFCGPEVIWGKVQYRIWNPHRISKSKKKNIQIGPETTKLRKLDLWGPVSHLGESTISDFESPSNFQVREKKLFISV